MKIYVDSRHRTAGTNEDFVWQIPETVDIPDSQAYVDCVLVPNVFFSVLADFNDRIHFFDEPVAVVGGAPTITPRRAILASVKTPTAIPPDNGRQRWPTGAAGEVEALRNRLIGAATTYTLGLPPTRAAPTM